MQAFNQRSCKRSRKLQPCKLQPCKLQPCKQLTFRLLLDFVGLTTVTGTPRPADACRAQSITDNRQQRWYLLVVAASKLEKLQNTP
jgi:hypothetical protein